MGRLIEELVVKYKADKTELSTGIKEAKQEMKSLSDAASSSSGGLLSGFKSAGMGVLDFGAKVGQTIFGLQSLAQGALSFGQSLIAPNASMEQTVVGFETLLGKGKQTQDFLAQMKKFAADTPFTFPEVTASAQHMLAFGFASRDVIPYLTNIGDAMSAMGKGSANIDHVVTVFGQMHAVGKLNAGDMMQLASESIPAWKFLAESMHKTIPEVQALTSKGLIPADAAIKAVSDGMHKMFGGGMAAQAQTFNGLMSTLQDNAGAALMAFTGPLFKEAKIALTELGNLVSSQQFQDFAATLGKDVGSVLNKLTPIIQGAGDAFTFVFTPIKQVVEVTRPLADSFDRATGIFRQVTQAAKPLTDTFDRARGIISSTTPVVKPLLDTFDRGKSVLADTAKQFKNVQISINPLIEIFTSLKPYVGDALDLFNLGKDILSKFGSVIMSDVVPGVEQVAGAVAPIIENFIKWNDKTHFLQNTMQDVGDLFRQVAYDVSTKLLPPVVDAINNFQIWVGKSNIVHDSMALLGAAIDIASGFVGGLVTGLSGLFGWFGQNKQQADLLKAAIFAIGGVMAGIKLVEFGKSVFSTFQTAKKDVQGFIDTVGKISDKLGNVLDFFKNKFSPGASGALDSVKTSADGATTSTSAIGPAATASQGEVASASALETSEIDGVGASAKLTAGEVGGIGTSATAASTVSKGALGGMAGVLGGIAGGVLAIVALAAGEFFLAKWIKETFHTDQMVSPQPDWVTHKNLGHAEGITNNPMGHMAWVGERGPEKMWIPGGASIYSHERSMRMGNESYPVRSSGGSVASSSSSSVGSSSGGTTSGQTFILEVDSMELARIVNTSTDRYVKLKIGARGRAA